MRSGSGWLFVYGSLRRAAGHPMHRVLAAGAVLVGRAEMPGRLYRVQHYPGAVYDSRGESCVQGELYRLQRPLQVLRRLDRYEGCVPGRYSPEFVRCERRVFLPDGEPVTAWIYEYNRDVTSLRPIAGGDYLAIPGLMRRRGGRYSG